MSIEVENSGRITQIFEAFGRGDIPFILSQLANDVRFTAHLDPTVPWSGEYSGKEGVMRYFQALGGAVDVTEAQRVTSLVAQGDTVVVMGNVKFNVRATGRAGASSWVYVWKLTDGQVTSFEQFADTGLADAFR
jgi:uncharacterized protein